MMKKNNVVQLARIKYDRKFYRICNTYEGVKDYQLTFSKELKKNTVFTPKIRIERYKGKGYKDKIRAPFEIILRLRTANNWLRCNYKTGLLRAGTKRAFFGDIPKIDFETGKHTPQHLALLQFSDDFKTVILDIYTNYYPSNKTELNKVLNTHSFIYNNSLILLKTA